MRSSFYCVVFEPYHFNSLNLSSLEIVKCMSSHLHFVVCCLSGEFMAMESVLLSSVLNTDMLIAWYSYAAHVTFVMCVSHNNVGLLSGVVYRCYKLVIFTCTMRQVRLE